MVRPETQYNGCGICGNLKSVMGKMKVRRGSEKCNREVKSAAGKVKSAAGKAGSMENYYLAWARFLPSSQFAFSSFT